MTGCKWPCEKCKVVLGVITQDASRVYRLSVLLQPAKELPDTPEYSVEGMEGGTVVCQNCQHRQTWHISDRLIYRLVERRRKRTFGLDESVVK